MSKSKRRTDYISINDNNKKLDECRQQQIKIKFKKPRNLRSVYTQSLQQPHLQKPLNLYQSENRNNINLPSCIQVIKQLKQQHSSISHHNSKSSKNIFSQSLSESQQSSEIASQRLQKKDFLTQQQRKQYKRIIEMASCDKQSQRISMIFDRNNKKNLHDNNKLINSSLSQITNNKNSSINMTNNNNSINMINNSNSNTKQLNTPYKNRLIPQLLLDEQDLVRIRKTIKLKQIQDDTEWNKLIQQNNAKKPFKQDSSICKDGLNQQSNSQYQQKQNQQQQQYQI